jgi:hypothetical protein
MGACETHSASHTHRGRKHTGTTSSNPPPNQQALSSLPIIGHRLPASSSFVLAGALPGRPGLRALQLDPDRAPARNPAAASKATTTGTTHPRRPEVTGPDQHAHLTAGALMGAVMAVDAGRRAAPGGFRDAEVAGSVPSTGGLPGRARD